MHIAESPDSSADGLVVRQIVQHRLARPGGRQIAGLSSLIVLLITGTEPALAADIDTDTRTQAARSYAAEISSMMYHWVSDELFHDRLAEDELQKISAKATDQVSVCVVERLSRQGDATTRAYVHTLADAQVDKFAADMLRRDYSSDATQPLTDTVNEAATECMSGVRDTLGLSSEANAFEPESPAEHAGTTKALPGNLELIYETDPQAKQPLEH